MRCSGPPGPGTKTVGSVSTHPGGRMTEQLPASVYPARLEVDYPEQHDRVTTLFRVFMVIPIGILIGVLTAGARPTVYNPTGEGVCNSSGGIASRPFPA